MIQSIFDVVGADSEHLEKVDSQQDAIVSSAVRTLATKSIPLSQPYRALSKRLS